MEDDEWCNLSPMIDRMGFLTAPFPVIVLPVSAAEKLQDKPLIQYLQYLTYFLSSGSSPCDRKLLFSNQIIFSSVLLLLLLFHFPRKKFNLRRLFCFGCCI